MVKRYIWTREQNYLEHSQKDGNSFLDFNVLCIVSQLAVNIHGQTGNGNASADAGGFAFGRFQYQCHDVFLEFKMRTNAIKRILTVYQV